MYEQAENDPDVSTFPIYPGILPAAGAALLPAWRTQYHWAAARAAGAAGHGSHEKHRDSPVPPAPALTASGQDWSHILESPWTSTK